MPVRTRSSGRSLAQPDARAEHIGVQPAEKPALRESHGGPSCWTSSRASTALRSRGRAPRLLALVGLDEKADSQARSSRAGSNSARDCVGARARPRDRVPRQPTTRARPAGAAATCGTSSAPSQAENRTVGLTTHYPSTRPRPLRSRRGSWTAAASSRSTRPQALNRRTANGAASARRLRGRRAGRGRAGCPGGASRV